jgi:hypothetical protein
MAHIFDACDEEEEAEINFHDFVHCLSTIFRGSWEEIMEFWCALAPLLASIGSKNRLYRAPLIAANNRVTTTASARVSRVRRGSTAGRVYCAQRLAWRAA